MLYSLKAALSNSRLYPITKLKGKGRSTLLLTFVRVSIYSNLLALDKVVNKLSNYILRRSSINTKPEREVGKVNYKYRT